MGTVELDMLLPDGSSRKCSLQKVLYVPKLAYNLVSVSRATEAGKSVTFSKGGCEFSDDSGQTTASIVSTIWNYAGSHKKVCMQSRRKAWRDCGIDALVT